MIRVGLVGYGFMGKTHAACYRLNNRARLVAVVEQDLARSLEAREQNGCDVYDDLCEMLSSCDIDVVDVCTQTELHEQCTVSVAKAGKHVLCEKPMALTIDACDNMIEAASNSGVFLMVAQVLRFLPEYEKIKEIVDSGAYGPVQTAFARRMGARANWTWNDWMSRPEQSGGAILDAHIHDQDYLAYLLGMPGKIQCLGTRSPSGAIDTFSSTMWDHASGADSRADGSMALAPGYPFSASLIVVCEKATIRYDINSQPTLMVYSYDSEPYAPELNIDIAGRSSNAGGNIDKLSGYYGEIDYFLSCVEAGVRPERVSPQSSRDAVRLCLAARKSVETGKTVDLGLPARKALSRAGSI